MCQLWTFYEYLCSCQLDQRRSRWIVAGFDSMPLRWFFARLWALRFLYPARLLIFRFLTPAQLLIFHLCRLQTLLSFPLVHLKTFFSLPLVHFKLAFWQSCIVHQVLDLLNWGSRPYLNFSRFQSRSRPVCKLCWPHRFAAFRWICVVLKPIVQDIGSLSSNSSCLCWNLWEHPW